MQPTYNQRNELLVNLGFLSYVDYLSSELWAEIRNAILVRDDGRCRVCKNRASVVHHIDYSEETMRGDLFDGLVAVCHGCHEKIEFDKDGKKRTLLQSRSAYYAACKKKLLNKLQHKNKRKQKKRHSNKPRCVCGNFRRHNRLKCRRCEPSGKIIVISRNNKHLFSK